jgi:hypothetical protein
MVRAFLQGLSPGPRKGRALRDGATGRYIYRPDGPNPILCLRCFYKKFYRVPGNGKEDTTSGDRGKH